MQTNKSPVTEEQRTPLTEEERKEAVMLWIEQEKIAMHFNDLALRLRLQALAGIGAATLVASGIFSKDGTFSDDHQLTMGWILIALAFVWAAVGGLDHHYYQGLLRGAVKEIIRVEKEVLRNVYFSTEIENAVAPRGRAARYAFYGLIFAILFVGGAWLVCMGLSSPARPAAEHVERGAVIGPAAEHVERGAVIGPATRRGDRPAR